MQVVGNESLIMSLGTGLYCVKCPWCAFMTLIGDDEGIGGTSDVVKDHGVGVLHFFFGIEELSGRQAVPEIFTGTFCQNTIYGQGGTLAQAVVGATGFPSEIVVSVEVKNQ